MQAACIAIIVINFECCIMGKTKSHITANY